MSCYNPIQAVKVPGIKTINGKDVIRFLKFEEGSIQENFERIKNGEVFTIPCGRCIGCRLDHARSWADRMILELDHTKRASFVTLTYRDEDLPEDPQAPEGLRRMNAAGAPVASLVKYHMSQFMKSLRADLDYNLEKIKYDCPWLLDSSDGCSHVQVRFLGCGEYGSSYGRPHMHLILFGLSLDDFAYLGDLKPVKRNELNQITYESSYLDKIWKKGFANVSEANYLTMGYVARYTTKKAQGNNYPKEYGLPEEFILMSRRPGIGAYFLEDHPDKLKEVSTWYDHGKEIYWPKYLIEKYFESDPEELDKIKSARRDLALNNFVNIFENDERPYYEKQMFLERQKESSVKKLVRGDVTLD